MKKVMLIWLAATAIISAVQAQSKKETRPVDEFVKITFRLPGTVYVRQGSPQKLEIEGNAEFIGRVETTVSEGRLSIGQEEGWKNWRWRDNERVTVWITTPAIEALTVSGSGDLIAEGQWTTGSLNLNVSGSGSMEVTVGASENIDANLSGSGKLFVAGSSKTFSSRVSGSGRTRMKMNVYETTALHVSGSGKIEASGSTGILQVHISGSGEVLALGLDSNKSDVRITGSGEAEVAVKDVLEATLAGSGSLLYRGSPGQIHTRRVGSGQIRKAE